MKNKAEQKFTSLLADLPAIKKLRQTQATVEKLRPMWDQIAEQPLAAHCAPVYFEDGCLLITVDGPAWHSELRHRSPAVLRKLHVLGFEEIQQLQIQFKPADIGPNRNEKPQREKPDQSSLAAIDQCARWNEDEQLTEVPGKACIKTLSKKFRKSTVKNLLAGTQP